MCALVRGKDIDETLAAIAHALAVSAMLSSDPGSAIATVTAKAREMTGAA